MARAFLMILDSFGIGAAPDADRYGDQGSDTLGHIAQACADGRADKRGLRSGPLHLPNLDKLGLGCAARSHRGSVPPGLNCGANVIGQWGYAVEQSRGKDTPSGHWEIAGVPVMFDWGYFPKSIPAMPGDLISDLAEICGLPGFLGNKHASGTEIVAELGEEHVRSGRPILYTSADSVLQIAAHESAFGLERLYETCEVARKLVDRLNIGRVIARPFAGDDAGGFERTANRRDYSVLPPAPTLLDRLTDAGREVISIGKIGDIFAHQGTGEIVKGAGNDDLFDQTLKAIDRLADGGLVITNFVDFDTLFGHRRDITGYAAALERFDSRLPDLFARTRPDDIVLFTADHGCDPSWAGTDHTRECVPILIFGEKVQPENIGRRNSFSDIGQTLAAHLGIAPLAHGEAWAV